MTPTQAKEANTLVDLYIACYKDKYKAAPMINRYRDKWGFVDMVTDLGVKESIEVVNYYFKTEKQDHPLPFLFNNYDKINTMRTQLIEDEKHREELRKLTKQRIAEQEAKSEQYRSEGN